MESENQKIIPVEIEREVKRSFLEYAMSVIVSRALPDVRDGLKPIHRRILYNMYENGLTPDKAYRKSATTVGDVMGRYHPHGDAAVYDALVRLAQDFSMRYPLVDGHGNFGSVDGDPAAAQRYTEARMSKVTLEMLSDIEKDTVDFMPNYDNRLKEPTVLPSRFPNLLVNGSVGIAVGMATNIAPHNLREIIDAAILLIDNPEAGLEELMECVKGPDFPTGGIIMGRAGIRAAYATGRGSIKVRARTEIEEYGNGRYRIAVSEIPYMVNKARLIEHIAELHKDKKVEGIHDLRDESDRSGMRIVVELKKDANPQVVLNQLFNYTELQSTFSVNTIALVENQPKTLTLRDLLYHYVRYQREIVARRTKFDMRKAMERAHIREGLHIAVDNIDEVIRIIRASKNENEAKKNLMERFASHEVTNLLDAAGEETDGTVPEKIKGLTEAQASAIVNMRLGQLTSLAAADLEREYAELMAKIAEYRVILASDERIYAIVKAELAAIRDKYGDERRTSIEAIDNEIDIEDLIREEDCVYTLTRFGYIKRLPATTYRSQRRGGRGVSGMSTRTEDIVETLFVASTHDIILFFTSAGRMYRLKGYQIPEGGRTAKGANIINHLSLDAGEKVTAMLHVRSMDEEHAFVFMATRNGTVKRVALRELNTARKAGLRALNLDEGDELVSARLTDGKRDILLATRRGNAMRFDENDVRRMGRDATGVRGIRLEEGDAVIGAAVIDEGGHVLSITENGYGKLTPEEEFTRHNRGGKGMILHKLTPKTGDVAGVLIPESGLSRDLMLITDSGTIIRTSVGDLRVCGRSSQGVIVMRPSENEKVISIAEADKEEEADQALPADGTEEADVEEGVEAVILDDPTEEAGEEPTDELSAEEASGDEAPDEPEEE